MRDEGTTCEVIRPDGAGPVAQVSDRDAVRMAGTALDASREMLGTWCHLSLIVDARGRAGRCRPVGSATLRIGGLPPAPSFRAVTAGGPAPMTRNDLTGPPEAAIQIGAYRADPPRRAAGVLDVAAA